MLKDGAADLPPYIVTHAKLELLVCISWHCEAGMIRI